MLFSRIFFSCLTNEIWEVAWVAKDLSFFKILVQNSWQQESQIIRHCPAEYFFYFNGLYLFYKKRYFSDQPLKWLGYLIPVLAQDKSLTWPISFIFLFLKTLSACLYYKMVSYEKKHVYVHHIHRLLQNPPLTVYVRSVGVLVEYIKVSSVNFESFYINYTCCTINLSFIFFYQESSPDCFPPLLPIIARMGTCMWHAETSMFVGCMA